MIILYGAFLKIGDQIVRGMSPWTYISAGYIFNFYTCKINDIDFVSEVVMHKLYNGYI